MPRTSRLLRRRVRAITLIALAALLLVAVFVVLWVGVRAAQARTHLATAQTLGRDVASQFGSSPEAVATTMPRIVDETETARDLTSDVVWRAAEVVPWVGPELRAVRVATDAVATLASDGLQPLGRAVGDIPLATLLPADGRIDVAAIGGLAQPAADAAAAASQSAAQLSSIDTTTLLEPLRGPIADASTLVGDVASGTDALARATRLLPAILGADGPRSYLVLVQNNAEWRSLGGIAGAALLVHTDNGTITFAETDTGQALSSRRERVGSLSSEQLAIYGDQPLRWFQDVTQPADFAVGAPIAKAAWEGKHGGTLDGVVSLDPVALSYFIRATGPVTLATGDVLTADTAVPFLLNEVYLRYDPKAQDAFFAATASSVFSALTKGDVSPGSLVEALAQAGDERRILLWSAHADEQSVLDATTLQGALPTASADRAEIGVYLNDATGSKMDYYMHPALSFTACGGSEAAFTLTLRNDAPANAASLPPSITGGSGFGTPAGLTRTVTYVYLPEGTAVTESASHDGEIATLRDGSHTVLVWSTLQSPGTSANLDVSLSTTSRTIALSATPGVYAIETHGVGLFCELAAQ